MTLAAYRRDLPLAIGVLALLLAGAAPAAADCAGDLTASQQNLERTRGLSKIRLKRLIFFQATDTHDTEPDNRTLHVYARSISASFSVSFI